MTAHARDASVKRSRGALECLQRHRSGNISQRRQSLRIVHNQRSDGCHRLCAVDERQALLRFKHHRRKPDPRQRHTTVKDFSPKFSLPFPYQSVCNVATGNHFDSAIAASGSEYLVTWTDTRNYATMGYDTYGARVSATGTVPNTEGFPICATPAWELYPSVAFDGHDFEVITLAYNSLNTAYDAMITRVNTATLFCFW